MKIGIPREIKDNERRVSLLPEAVRILVRRGHQVFVQRHAGTAAGFPDNLYRQAGGRLVSSLATLYRRSEMVVKVKEPQPEEYDYLRVGQRLFCYLHLAANPSLTQALKMKRVEALAFETLEDVPGHTPLLQPMSEIAGRLATLLGANALRSDLSGKGVLLSPTTYSVPGRVVVVGAGHVGRAAAEVAWGLGARVWVLDRRIDFLRDWVEAHPGMQVRRSTPRALVSLIREADLLIGAVYIPGARAPQLISEGMVKSMAPGSVLVDVAVDQGGCSETTRPTSLSHPTYRLHGVIHCAVPNLPALVSHTASQALSTAILPYVIKLAGIETTEKIMAMPTMKNAVNISAGEIVHPRVWESFEKKC